MDMKESLHAQINPIALRKAKVVCNFGPSECNRVNAVGSQHRFIDWFESLLFKYIRDIFCGDVTLQNKMNG